MVKKSMYQKIQELKRKGFNVSQISIQLKLNRRTVRKYFKMEGSDFRDYQNKHLYRDKKLKPYEEDILEIYRENGFRKLNMASVFDYLEEMHTELPCSEKLYQLSHQDSKTETTGTPSSIHKGSRASIWQANAT